MKLIPLLNTLQKATHTEDINLFTLIEEEVSVSIFFMKVKSVTTFNYIKKKTFMIHRDEPA